MVKFFTMHLRELFELNGEKLGARASAGRRVEQQDSAARWILLEASRVLTGTIYTSLPEDTKYACCKVRYACCRNGKEGPAVFSGMTSNYFNGMTDIVQSHAGNCDAAHEQVIAYP